MNKRNRDIPIALEKLETLDPGIRVVKIARREALNALNTETLEELNDAVRLTSGAEERTMYCEPP